MNEKYILVDAVPNNLNFNIDEPLENKFTLYNFHEDTIYFKVFSTAVENYKVIPPSGLVRSQHKVEIKIELNDDTFEIVDSIFKILIYLKPYEKHVKEIQINTNVYNKQSDDNSDIEKNDYKSSENLILKKNDILSDFDVPCSNLNIIMMSSNRFCIYIFIIFFVGLITGIFIDIYLKKSS